MYNNYCNFLKTINNSDLINFKNNKQYCGILEHVTYELGLKYLKLIEAEFKSIDHNIVVNFIKINDTYGNPVTFKYVLNHQYINCSPTTLRYIYHSLIILDYYKTTNCENIVEVGCGYGGLCLAINYFAMVLNIKIINYNIIDLPEPCNLIKSYLDLHKEHVHSNINIHLSETYGENVNHSKLFFISNYCYTEIDLHHNLNYSNNILQKSINGFIIWQNGGNKGIYPIDKCSKITSKLIKNVIEEKPQTDAGYGIYKNYFVYF